MNPAAYPIAVVAAGVNASSNVLQRAANREEPAELKLRPRLVLDLLHRPLWLAGFGAVIASFLLLATALDMGSLAGVDPIIALELPLTLVLAARVFGSRLQAREWLAVSAMTLGLAGLVVFLHPSGGTGGQASALSWGIGVAVSVGAVAGLTLIGLRSSGLRAAAVLGTGTGMAFGLTAAFMKGMTAHLHGGLTGVLTAWPTYAMAASGLAGMYLLQSAFQSGPLVAAQPGITLADPLVAILWGVLVFGERPSGGLELGLAVASGLVMAAATVFLVRSPLLSELQRQEEQHQEEQRPGEQAQEGERRSRGQRGECGLGDADRRAQAGSAVATGG